MKLSDLIIKLLAIQAKKGDLDVYIAWGPTDEDVIAPYDYANPQVIEVDVKEDEEELIQQKIFKKDAILI